MKWYLSPKIDQKIISANAAYNPLVLQLLYNRGLKSSAEIKNFLEGAEPADYNPARFRDMARIVDRLIFHIKAGNKIMVYGDYDADGVTATAVLYQALETLKAKAGYYLPDRISEGYGLNKTALENFAKDNYKLVITVDTGIRNKPEIDFGRELGLEIIITDHHALPENPAEISDCLTIDCADKSEDYPAKTLAGVGMAYKLVEALLAKSSLDVTIKQKILKRSLDLVAIGTVADMVSLLGENRFLVQKGLEVLNNTKRLGLQELLKVGGIAQKGQTLDAGNIGFQIGPRLNAASRLEHASTALELLLTTDKVEAQKLATDLNDKNNKRQKITQDIMAMVEDQVDKDNLPPIILASSEFSSEPWSEGVIGLVAGRLTEKYYRPVFIITKTELGYKSSGRSIEEFNLISALEESQEFLDKYGGHPMACGFSIYSDEKLEKFKNKITEIAKAKLTGQELIPKLKIDAELNPADIDLKIFREIEKLEPCGQNNPRPKFAVYSVLVQDIVKMGKESEHIKIKIGGLSAIAFGKSETYQDIKIGQKIDLAYYLELNEFNGRVEPQLKIIDIKF